MEVPETWNFSIVLQLEGGIEEKLLGSPINPAADKHVWWYANDGLMYNEAPVCMIYRAAPFMAFQPAAYVVSAGRHHLGLVVYSHRICF